MPAITETRAASARRPAVRSARWSSALTTLLLAIMLAIPAGVSVLGLPYYLELPAERLRDPLHAALRPSGTVGQSFGLAGLGLFLFMWVYPLLKKWPRLRLGRLSHWLDFHVVVGLALPVIVAVHAGWRFTGLIGMGYLSMLLVCLSGLVGRYIYIRIPRHRDGLELSREEAVGQLRALTTEIAAQLKLDPVAVEESLAAAIAPLARPGIAGSLWRMLADDFARRGALRKLRKVWESPRPGRPALDTKAVHDALRLASREIRLAQQLRMLERTHRVFRWWHIAHRPFAITALIAIVVHVSVAVATGHTWLH